MTGKLLLATVMAAAIIVPAVTESAAFAQGSDADKKAAKAAYKKGTSAYNLGQWDKAIKFFTEAFETYPDAAFLYNLAQTHRQASHCKEASFFYGRYLSMKPNAPNRAEVESFVRDLDAECARRSPVDPGSDPGTGDPGTGDPGTGDPGTGDPGTGDPGTDDPGPSDPGPSDPGTDDPGTGDPGMSDEKSDPSAFVAYLGGGPAFVSAGDLDIPVRGNFVLSAGYPLHFGDIRLDVGGLASYTPIAFENVTVHLVSLLLNAGVSMEVANKVRVRGELGLGMMAYGGLSKTPFLPDTTTTGALSSFNLRVAFGVEYEIVDSLSVYAQPLVLNFAPTPSGVSEDIGNVSAFQMALGLSYSM